MGQLQKVVLMGLLALPVACDPGCDICTTSAIVHGTISTAAGEPVEDVELDVQVFMDSCEQVLPDGGTDGLLPRTDAQGAYEARPFSLRGPFVARCLRVTLDPRDRSPWPAESVERLVELEFRSDYKGPSRDRVQLDITLSME